MGLIRNMTPTKLKKAQRILEAMECYGVTEEDIPLIAEIKNIIVDVNNIKATLTNTSINTQKAKTSNKMSVEEALNTYFKPEEDFNPHGTSTNNKL